MGVRSIKPNTSSQRHKIVNSFSGLSHGYSPEKSLLVPVKKTGGRNNTGKMTMRYIGGRHKRMLRVIDFRRDKDNVPGKVKSIEYDPFRTCFVALIYYTDGEKRYILAPSGLMVGDVILSGDDIQPEIGCCLPVKSIPTGTMVHNVELNPGAGGKVARSAGSYARISSKDSETVLIRLSSGEIRNINPKCRATVGVLSNSDHFNCTVGKAGSNRMRGIRPRVRGVAMNPVDHPMGGGEGKASGGHPRTRLGVVSRGLKTRRSKKYSDMYIIQKRK